MSILKPYLKSKWCDTAYFQAQVRAPFAAWLAKLRVTRACARVAGSQHVIVPGGAAAFGYFRVTNGGDGFSARDVFTRRVCVQRLVRSYGQ